MFKEHHCSCIIISSGTHPAIFLAFRDDITIKSIPDKEKIIGRRTVEGETKDNLRYKGNTDENILYT